MTPSSSEDDEKVKVGGDEAKEISIEHDISDITGGREEDGDEDSSSSYDSDISLSPGDFDDSDVSDKSDDNDKQEDDVMEEEEGSMNASSLGSSFCKWEDGSYSMVTNLSADQDRASTRGPCSMVSQSSVNINTLDPVPALSGVFETSKAKAKKRWEKYVVELPKLNEKLGKSGNKRKIKCKLCKLVMVRKSIGQHIKYKH